MGEEKKRQIQKKYGKKISFDIHFEIILAERFYKKQKLLQLSIWEKLKDVIALFSDETLSMLHCPLSFHPKE